MLNRITGQMTVLNQQGVKVYNGLTHDFYVLDKTLQSVEMTEQVGRGDRKGKDDLKVKTIDGSDVYVDLKVQYKIDADMAAEVLTTSGPGEAYKEKWTRDYVRSAVRNYLGELTTEDFYDSSKRNELLRKARDVVNERIQPYGILVDSIVIPRRPHFYKEYEEMIKKKKLADQGVLEEQSKALAAKQAQETAKVEETNLKNVAVEEFTGEMEQLVIKAEADAEKVMREADAYSSMVTIGAEAALYEMTQSAEGIVAKKKAEAEGIEALKEALEGEGGRNMVKMEYAKKLQDVSITGQPYTIQQDIERFEHLQGALRTGRRAKGESK